MLYKPGTKFIYHPINHITGDRKINDPNDGRIGQIVSSKPIGEEDDEGLHIYFFRFLDEIQSRFVEEEEMEIIDTD